MFGSVPEVWATHQVAAPLGTVADSEAGMWTALAHQEFHLLSHLEDVKKNCEAGIAVGSHKGNQPSDEPYGPQQREAENIGVIDAVVDPAIPGVPVT